MRWKLEMYMYAFGDHVIKYLFHILIRRDIVQHTPIRKGVDNRKEKKRKKKEKKKRKRKREKKEKKKRKENENEKYTGLGRS